MGLWLASQRAKAQDQINYADWHLEWAEEFNTPLDTTALAERWRFFYPWGRALDTPLETGYYTAEELQTANGTLNMTMHRQATPRRYRDKELRYTTPLLISRHPTDSLHPTTCNPGEGFSYGLFEVRVRQPQSTDAAPGFWLFGGVPDEIDVFEGDANTIANNFHLASGGYWRPSFREPQACQCFFYNTNPTANLHQQYHTYGMSWLPNEVVFYFDGVPIRHETRFVPAGCAMGVIVNLAAYAWANVASDTLAVDYIRIYRPRHLPYVPPVLRPAGALPQTELAWLPAEVQPGRLDQSTHQTWQLTPMRRSSTHLALQLTDNYNPPCNQLMPLPRDGRWAPAWVQTSGIPELRVQVFAPDSLHWTVYSLINSHAIAHGVTAGGGTWLPRWDALPPGAYGLCLRQGRAITTQLLTIVARPSGSGPTPDWQRPVPVVADPE